MKRGSKELQEYWRKHVTEQTSTGLSRSAYCRKHHLKDHALKYWIDRLSSAGKEAAFVSLPQRNTNHDRSIQITLSNGIIVRCDEGVGLTWLKNLVETLQS
jgi:hypothetical protein